MNKRSPLFRKLNCFTCGHSRLNCLALRISRSLDEACRALPANKRCRRDCSNRHGHDCPHCHRKH